MITVIFIENKNFIRAEKQTYRGVASPTSANADAFIGFTQLGRRGAQDYLEQNKRSL